jgi:hypothetical protein
MDIFLDKRAAKQIRLSATEAVEEGDMDSLREDMAEAFTDEQIEEIERRIDNADFFDFLGEILDEWSGDDVDELFELLEGQLSDAGVDLKYTTLDVDEETEAPEEEEEGEDDVVSLSRDEDEDL